MRRRRLAVAAGVAVALVITLVAVAAARHHGNDQASEQEASHVVSVVRRDLVTRQTFDGSLGYSDPRPLVDRIAGTITEVPAEGALLRRGAVVYRVDTRPVALLFGALPAWRALAPGATGADVRQLQRNLNALGHRSTARGVYDEETAAAVSSWQRTLGEPATGRLPLGSVVFLPGPRRVGTVRSALGEPIAPGGVVLSTSALGREAVLRIAASDQGLVRAGETVDVALPGGRVVPGRIDDVGKVASARPGEPPAVTIRVAVDARAVTTLDQAPISISVEAQRKRNAIAVPVEALLALRGGGYALEVIGASGKSSLVRVLLGTFADGYVEVAGAGIKPGVRVTAAE